MEAVLDDRWERFTVVGRDDQEPASAWYLHQAMTASAWHLTLHRGGPSGNAIVESQFTDAWLAQCQVYRLVISGGDSRQFNCLRHILPRLPRLTHLTLSGLHNGLLIPVLGVLRDLQHLQILKVTSSQLSLPPYTPELVLPDSLLDLSFLDINLSAAVIAWITRGICQHRPAGLFILQLGTDDLPPPVIGAFCEGLVTLAFPLQLNLNHLDHAVTCSQLCNLFQLCTTNRHVSYKLRGCPLGVRGAGLHARYLQQLCPAEHVWEFQGLLEANDEVGFDMPVVSFWDILVQPANRCYQLNLARNPLTDPLAIMAMVKQAPYLRELSLRGNPVVQTYSQVQALLQMWTGDIQLSCLDCGSVQEGPTLSEAAFTAWLLAEKWVVNSTEPLKWPRLVTLSFGSTPQLRRLLRRRTSLLTGMKWSPSNAMYFTLPAFNQRIWTIMMIFQRKTQQLSLLQGGGRLSTGHNQLRFRMLPEELIFLILEYWLRRDELEEVRTAIGRSSILF